MADQVDLDRLRRELRDEQYRLDRQHDKLTDAKNKAAQIESWINGTSERIYVIERRIAEIEELLALRERVAHLEARETSTRGAGNDGDE